MNEHNFQEHEKHVKVLIVIFKNIRQNPNKDKYQNLNLNRIWKKLNKCQSCIKLLCDAGFYKSGDDKRLLYDTQKMDELTNLHQILSILLSDQHQSDKKTIVMPDQQPLLSTTFQNNASNAENGSVLDQIEKMLDNPGNTSVSSLNLPPYQNVRDFVNRKLNTNYQLLDPCDVKKCPHLYRICIILNAYHQCCSANKQIYTHVFKQVYNEKNLETQLLNDYNHILEKHNDDHFETIYEHVKRETNNNMECNLPNCLLFFRNRRDTSDEKMCNDLYTVNNTNNTDSCREIVQQQLLDRVHSLFFHSYDIGYKINAMD
eukprot:112941_1